MLAAGRSFIIRAGNPCRIQGRRATMNLRHAGMISLLAALALTASACVYRVDVQQGNLLDDDDIAAVKPGMTRSQVRFLLGTPVVVDTFQRDRWDYVYFLRKGRDEQATKRWIIVTFDGDKVSEVRKDVAFSQTS